MPATSMFSLTVNGTPCSGPRASVAASAASAAARASSASTSTTALRWPLTASMRSRCASTTSREDTSPAAISSASSPAPRRHSSSDNALSSCFGNASRGHGVTTGMATLLKASLISAAVALALPAAASAAPEIRTVSGASPAALEATINAFKADAGDRRSEINWDGVPASATFPNRFPGGFFGGQRGAEFDTPGIGTEISNGSPWGGGFQRYSGEKLFAPVGSNYTNVRFNVPGTQRQAFTSAFGVVLSDVDTTAGAERHVPGLARRDDPRRAGPARPERPVASSACASATASASPRSRSAPASSPIAPGVVDSPQNDLAALDDVIFSEPQADLAPPPETQFVPVECPAGLRASGAAAPRPRASLITLAKSVRRNRTLKVIVGSSARHRGRRSRSARPSARSRSRRARPRSRSRSPRTPSAASRSSVPSSSAVSGRSSRRA